MPKEPPRRMPVVKVGEETMTVPVAAGPADLTDDDSDAPVRPSA